MLSSLLLVLLTQVLPCTPGELSLACTCKQGMGSACVALVGNDALKAAEVLAEVEAALEALEQPSRMAAKEDERKKQRLEVAAQSLSNSLGSSEPPNCKGQNHHLISRLIAKALERHLKLKGLYKPRDPRFVARAKDEPSHCGYQEWHRKLDAELIDWLEKTPEATPQEFMGKLREIYSRPEMRARFPHGF